MIFGVILLLLAGVCWLGFRFRAELVRRFRVPETADERPLTRQELLSKTLPLIEEKEKALKEVGKLSLEKRHLEEANKDLTTIKDELDEQNSKLIESNLNLLELKEELDEQKYKLAEANLKMLELTEKLRDEQEKSNRLLHNILPDRVIRDLNEKGHCEPECFEQVTVFFSDIVNFTSISSRLAPQVVIAELNDIFTEFDRVFTANHCERIKTIGDAYLSVSGMPEPDPQHWRNVLNAALEAMAYLEKRNRQPGKLNWRMRMGIHTGAVVGGIVGVEKYIYDVFGDAINTAARMETNSEPMRINVSETTWQLADGQFRFQARPAVNVKGKGRMNMYFLESKLPVG